MRTPFHLGILAYYSVVFDPPDAEVPTEFSSYVRPTGLDTARCRPDARPATIRGMNPLQPVAASPVPSVRRGVVIVVSHEERLLVIRRSVHVVAPRKQCFPGGHIEPGESEEEAVAREFREELGGEVVARERLWKSISPRGVHLNWWTAELRDAALPLAPNPAEVEEAFWCGSREMALLPDLLDSNREFLQALAEGRFALGRAK
jgi:8-oxo-dGTP diphosphatase